MSITQPLPDLELPPALAKAEQVRADRAADLAQAQEALRAAHIAVETAVLEDRACYAESRDRGQDDPGPQAETAARDEVGQAERRLAGEQLRLARAEDELSAAVTENIDGWAERLGKLWRRRTPPPALRWRSSPRRSGSGTRRARSPLGSRMSRAAATSTSACDR